MKIKFNLQKKIIISTILLAFFITTNNASALFNIDFPNLIQNTTQVINQIKEGVRTVQEVKNTLNTVKNTAQSLKNFDLTQAASNASGLALSQIGDIVTKNIGTSKDSSTNVFTNGQQIIGDLNNYLNKSSTNAIKKSLNDLQGADTNPYQSKALTDTIKKLRNDAQSSVDKLKVVGLAAIAQKEICNDVKLKDVIKKGEPANWVKPKPALKNVNIDELCNGDLTAKDTSSSQNDVYNISSWKIPLKKGMSDNNSNSGSGSGNQNNSTPTNNTSNGNKPQCGTNSISVYDKDLGYGCECKTGYVSLFNNNGPYTCVPRGGKCDNTGQKVYDGLGRCMTIGSICLYGDGTPYDSNIKLGLDGECH
ncbi:MAG: hypothetical protein QG630_63 [Patescibacteria group bacterium]|nr:hypothetical protein [Patescibacteria group bacterium]